MKSFIHFLFLILIIFYSSFLKAQDPVLVCSQIAGGEEFLLGECPNDNIEVYVNLRKVGPTGGLPISIYEDSECDPNPTFQLDVCFNLSSKQPAKADLMDAIGSSSDSYFEYKFYLDFVSGGGFTEETVVTSDYIISATGDLNRHELDLNKLIDDYYDPSQCVGDYLCLEVPIYMKYLDPGTTVNTILNSPEGLYEEWEEITCGGSPVSNNSRRDAVTLGSKLHFGTNGSSTDISTLIGSGSNDLPSDGIMSAKSEYVFHGEIVVDESYTFDGFTGAMGVRQRMQMADGASFTIQNGYSLTFDFVNIESCENNTWDGITAEQGGTLDFDDCFVTDATTAAFIEDGATLSATNGNEFTNNGTVIKLQDVNGTGSATVSLTNNTFQVDGDNKVSANSYGVFSIGISNWEASNNVFKNLDVGARLSESIATFEECEFIGITGLNASNIFGIGAVHSSNNSLVRINGFGKDPSDDLVFDNCPYAVTGFNNSEIQLRDSKIEECEIGVRNVLGRRSILFDNSITANEEAFNSSYSLSNMDILYKNDLIASGENDEIVVNLSSNLTRPNVYMYDNFVDANGTSGGGLITNNIGYIGASENFFDLESNSYNNSKGANLSLTRAFLNCNTFLGRDNGGNTQDGISARTLTGSVKCNVFEKNDYGFECVITSPIDMSTNEFKKQYTGLYIQKFQDINRQEHNGNTWTGTYGSTYGAQNLNDTEDAIKRSEIIVDDGQGSDLLPNWDTGEDNNAFAWFVDEFNSNSLATCPSTCDPALADRGELYDNIEESVAYWQEYLNPDTSHNFLDGELFNQRSDLYRDLKELDSIPDSLGTWYTTYESSDEAELVDLQDELADILVDSEIDVPDEFLASDSLLGLYLDTMTLATYELDTAALNTWETDVQAVTTQSTQAADVKDIMLLIGKSITELDNFTTQEENTITDLANSCPSDKGYGVYLARSLAYPLWGNTYDDVTLCDTINSSRGANNFEITESNPDLLIYPNPAMNYLTIELPKELLGFDLTIYDYMGQAIDKLTIDNTRMKLDVSRYRNGIYFIQVEGYVQRFMKSSK